MADKEKVPLIYAAMLAVLDDVGAIAKTRDGPQGQYMFRGIDDVYNALHGSFAKHGIFMTPEVQECITDRYTTAKGTVWNVVRLRVKHIFYARDGSSVSATTQGEGTDAGDKASYKAMSGAAKYALLESFCIATEEEKDPEGGNPGARLPVEEPGGRAPNGAPPLVPPPVAKPMVKAGDPALRESTPGWWTQGATFDFLKDVVSSEKDGKEPAVVEAKIHFGPSAAPVIKTKAKGDIPVWRSADNKTWQEWKTWAEAFKWAEDHAFRKLQEGTEGLTRYNDPFLFILEYPGGACWRDATGNLRVTQVGEQAAALHFVSVSRAKARYEEWAAQQGGKPAAKKKAAPGKPGSMPPREGDEAGKDDIPF